MPIELAVACVVMIGGSLLYLRGRRARQFAFIEAYRFHPALGEKYPHLDDAQVDLVFRGLKDYFAGCHRAGRRTVAMPSQAVDAAWHEFILFTRAYQSFSKRAIGRFLHHTPATAMGSPTRVQDNGIKRAWRLACASERIDPARPTRLPLLFAIDDRLGIQDGFRYALNCRDKRSSRYGEGYCAGHFGCASGCAGDSGDNSGGFIDGWFDGDGGCGSCGGD